MSILHRFKTFTYEKARLEAFSDAVIAIIITLLILEIKIPKLETPSNMHTTYEAFWELRGEIISWVISFAMVSVAWLQHHNVLHMSRKADLGILWLNLFFLMGLCFVPFTTGFMGKNYSDPFAVSLFAAELGLTSLFLCWLYAYATKHYLKPNYSVEKVRKNVRRSFWIAPVVYFGAALLAWVSVWIAYLIFILIPFLFLFPLDVEISDGINERN